MSLVLLQKKQQFNDNLTLHLNRHRLWLIDNFFYVGTTSIISII